MFDSDISHYLTDRTVSDPDQIYIGLDNRTGMPMLAIPGTQHAVVGAYYYELSQDEYEEAKKDIRGWYNKEKARICKAA